MPGCLSFETVIEWSTLNNLAKMFRNIIFETNMSSSWWTNIRARRLTNVVPQLRRQENPFPRPISPNFSFISIPIKIGGKLQDFCILATSKFRSICHILTHLPFLRVYAQRIIVFEETRSQARRAKRSLFSNNCVLRTSHFSG